MIYYIQTAAATQPYLGKLIMMEQTANYKYRIITQQNIDIQLDSTNQQEEESLVRKTSVGSLLTGTGVGSLHNDMDVIKWISIRNVIKIST